jgi:hypothetical protein
MNTVKIYKGEDEILTITIESETTIDSSQYVVLWDCKEEIYIDEELIETNSSNCGYTPPPPPPPPGGGGTGGPSGGGGGNPFDGPDDGRPRTDGGLGRAENIR